MKWFLAVFLVCLAGIAVGEPESQPVSDKDVQCQAGTEWESYCNQCLCLENGIAKCQKQEPCVSSSIGEPITCKPNSIFKRGCNVCRCQVDGQVSCVSHCDDEKALENLKKPERVENKNKYCAPGTKWTTPCSECECSDDGKPICTKGTCTDEKNDIMYRCAPESTWMNSCNQCYCTSDGVPLCTRMECVEDAFKVEFDADDKKEPDNEKETANIEPGNEIEVILIDDPHNLLKRSVCKPNREFQMDCNPCKCAPDGQSFTCERNECMETEDDTDINKDVEVFMKNEGADHIERHSENVCKPRAIFSIGCNTCLCNKDGSDYICTNKPCPLPKDVEVFDELKVIRSRINQPDAGKATKITCSPNQMFIKDCNTCWCNKDGTSYSCTRKACEVSPPQDGEEILEKDKTKPKQKCRPDEVFEMDCNMCRCNSDGTSFSCTRRACYPDDDLKDTSKTRKTRAATQELAKACQPGQEFRLDCNKCLCDNEGTNFSCTRIDCNGLNTINGGTRSKRDTTKVIRRNCTAGSVFNDDCNVCSCDSQGLKATCTTHSCYSPKSIYDLNYPAPDPNFRCNPGDQYRRDCNDCTCTADGKSIFCTLRMCPMYKP